MYKKCTKMSLLIGNIWKNIEIHRNRQKYGEISMIDVQKILSLPEGKTLEFKRDLSSMEPILKTLIAFANTAGGTLLIT